MTEDDWWARVDESPGDPGLFSFFADWLGDQGDPCEGAAREVVRREWVPYHCHNGPRRGYTWDWYRADWGWGPVTGRRLPCPAGGTDRFGVRRGTGRLPVVRRLDWCTQLST
jgi:hypothetical protein